MHKPFYIIYWLSIILLVLIKPTYAGSWFDEGARELEELRLRQLQSVQSSDAIAPFTTDGCSGFQSQSWEFLAGSFPGFEEKFDNKPPWENCCEIHDKAYWQGSVIDGYKKRLNADEDFKQCIAETGKNNALQLSRQFSVSEEQVEELFELISELMYQAVRLSGGPCSLLPWRWGYGWDNCAFATISELPEQYSDIKFDEHVTFFNTSAWLDADGAHWNIPIHGWIYEPQDSQVRSGFLAKLLESTYELQLTTETKDNFYNRSNVLIADNERGKRVVIQIAGREFTLPDSKENGHIYHILKLPTKVANAFSNQGYLHFFAVTHPEDRREYQGKIKLVASSGISVISDIDDTVKVTNVINPKQLFDNTFFKEFKAVDGMPQFYQHLHSNGAEIHFVSSSPWQFYSLLEQFMLKAGFPWATISLKSVRFRDETLLNLFKPGIKTKPNQIESILQRYPGRRFILIGDSGEQDPEVYGDIARRYPSQILRILIRIVDSSAPEDERYQIAFKEIPRAKWHLFDHPDNKLFQPTQKTDG